LISHRCSRSGRPARDPSPRDQGCSGQAPGQKISFPIASTGGANMRHVACARVSDTGTRQSCIIMQAGWPGAGPSRPPPASLTDTGWDMVVRSCASAYPPARLGRLRSSLAEARGSAIWRAKGAAAPRPGVLFQGMRQALSHAARWDSRVRTRLLLSIWSKRTLDSARYSRQAGGLRPEREPVCLSLCAIGER